MGRLLVCVSLCAAILSSLTDAAEICRRSFYIDEDIDLFGELMFVQLAVHARSCTVICAKLLLADKCPCRVSFLLHMVSCIIVSL